MLPTTLAGAAIALAIALPLAIKMQLGVRRVGVAVIALGVLAGMLISALDPLLRPTSIVAVMLVALTTLVFAVALLLQRFYRDPEREIPQGDGIVVSPADGEVIYVHHCKGGILPVATKQGRPYALEELTHTRLHDINNLVIGIGMSFLDVHINRAPIAGRITMRRHFPGGFHSLKRHEAVFENERATTLIQGQGLHVAVVQIASRLVRQIVSWVEEGDEVRMGDRVGVIRFGSQVDLVLPARPDLQIVVSPGKRVTAGESVVATLGAPAGRGQALMPLSAAQLSNRQIRSHPVRPLGGYLTTRVACLLSAVARHISSFLGCRS